MQRTSQISQWLRESGVDTSRRAETDRNRNTLPERSQIAFERLSTKLSNTIKGLSRLVMPIFQPLHSEQRRATGDQRHRRCERFVQTTPQCAESHGVVPERRNPRRARRQSRRGLCKKQLEQPVARHFVFRGERRRGAPGDANFCAKQIGNFHAKAHRVLGDGERGGAGVGGGERWDVQCDESKEIQRR
jgi:hypothetical protein